MNIHTHARKGQRWTDEDDKFLALSWETGVSIREASEELGRTQESLHRRARMLCLKRKTP